MNASMVFLALALGQPPQAPPVVDDATIAKRVAQAPPVVEEPDPFSKIFAMRPTTTRNLPVPSKRTSKEDMWYGEEDQAALSELLQSTKTGVSGIYFYRQQEFTPGDFVDPWIVPGGLKGLLGWRSYNGVGKPPSGSWTTGAPYEDGQTFIDMLVNAKTGKVFTLRTSMKADGEWRNRVVFADKHEFPSGFEPSLVRCADCHTPGQSAPRSKEGRISFLR